MPSDPPTLGVLAREIPMSESTETTYHCLGCGHTPTVRNASPASEPDCIRCGTHLVKVTSPTDDIAAMFDAYECCIIARVHAALDNDSGWSRILAKSNQMRDTLLARLASRSSSGAPELTPEQRSEWADAKDWATRNPEGTVVMSCDLIAKLAGRNVAGCTSWGRSTSPSSRRQ